MLPLKSEPVSDASARQGLLPLSQIQPRPDQPRSQYDFDSLEELKDSIRCHGILEPLVVRPLNGRFEIVCGERRYRAALDLGLTCVPVRSIDLDSEKAFLVAIHENVHRDSLTPIDEARAYSRLMNSGQPRSQREIARLVNVSQARISQRLALLQMPEEIILALSAPGAELTERHARVLRQLPQSEEQCVLARRIIAERLTVDQTIAIVSAASAAAGRPRRGGKHSRWTVEHGVRYRASARGLEVQCAATTLAEQVQALRELAERLEASAPSRYTSSTGSL